MIRNAGLVFFLLSLIPLFGCERSSDSGGGKETEKLTEQELYSEMLSGMGNSGQDESKELVSTKEYARLKNWSRPLVLRMGVEQGSNSFRGSCVIIKRMYDSFLAYTCAHVVAKDKDKNTGILQLLKESKLTVFFGENAYTAAVLWVDGALDIAIVEFRSSVLSDYIKKWDLDDRISTFTWGENASQRRVPGNMKRGDWVLSLGYPLVHGEELFYSKGHVFKVTASDIEHTAPVEGGSSGGALINSKGRLVGINKSMSIISKGNLNQATALSVRNSLLIPGHHDAKTVKDWRVEANQGWQSSGIYMKPGDVALVTVRGRWKLGSWVGKCDAEGTSTYPEYRMYNSPFGSLIGTISRGNPEGREFEILWTVGHMEVIAAENRSGWLWFRCNDNDVKNNVHSLKLSVTLIRRG